MSDSQPSPTPGPRRRARAGGRKPMLYERDLDVLSWMAEQYAARMDHLEALLGSTVSMRRTLARLRFERLITTEQFLVGEQRWVTPTSAGLRACGSSFKTWHPRVGRLAHVAAVNGVRLHTEDRAPASRWVCERILRGDYQAGEHVPDGVVLLTEQRVAIEVELTLKPRRLLEAKLNELATRFDGVAYFCALGPFVRLTELSLTGRWPGLAVRPLPSEEVPW